MGPVLAASQSPNLISRTPSVDLNSLSGAGEDALNRLRGWAPVTVPGGRVDLRFKGINASGQTVYEARGGKKTVTVRADSFAEAAKKVEQLVATKALAPRGTATAASIWSSVRANPRVSVKVPAETSFLGTAPGQTPVARRASKPPTKTSRPAPAETSTTPTTSPTVTLIALVPKKLPASTAPDRVLQNRNPLILGYYNSPEKRQSVSPLRPCPTDSTAAPVKSANDPNAKKPGINARSIATYSVLSAVASYNINLATGMSAAKALALLPAGAARDIIAVALAQLPLDSIKNPYLEVAAKGSAGGVVTLLSNLAAKARYGAPAWPSRHIHVGMVLAAFTVNGLVIGLKDLQKQGYLGGLPPDNPQGFKQWFQKYGQEAAAIGGGVGIAMTSVVTVKQVLNAIAGRGFDVKKILMTLGLSTALPAIQSLTGRAATSSLCADVPAETQNGFNLKTMLVDALNYMGASAMVNKVQGQPITKAGLGKSFGTGLGLAVIAEQLKMVGADYTLKQYTHESLKNIDTAREALTDISTLLTHPGRFLLGANRSGGNEAYIEALKEYQTMLYKLHPTLKPASK